MASDSFHLKILQNKNNIRDIPKESLSHTLFCNKICANWLAARGES